MCIRDRSGAFIKRGEKATPLPTDKSWHFTPRAEAGQPVEPGQLIGVVAESHTVEHRVLCPPDCRGALAEVKPEGDYTVNDVVAIVRADGEARELTLCQRWPVRTPRPYALRQPPHAPLVTGQRVIDTFFPIGRGGAAAIPGGFGTGKTMTQHALAKWSDADIIVYVGCGERGNEMTDVLTEFPKLVDPRTGHPLMERTVLIANTSNMPVAAREVSIYTGITIAEYYRSLGNDVVMMMDSITRVAMAQREVGLSAGEPPTSKGYTPSVLALMPKILERAGTSDKGTITGVYTVLVEGDDVNEPVSDMVRSIIDGHIVLSRKLANRNHYPAIDILQSISRVQKDVIDDRHRELVTQLIEMYADYTDAEDLINIGAYVKGSNPRIDRAINRIDAINEFLRQGIDEFTPPEEMLARLAEAVGGKA